MALPGVRAHQLRHWSAREVVERGGLRLTAPEVAAVRGAVWLPTDRAAATLLTMVVQQRLVNKDRYLEAALALPRRGRAAKVQQYVADVVDGAHSLGELDFAALCVKHGIPAPERQVMLRRRGQGSMHLDVRWAGAGLVVEIDGIQHFAAQNIIADSLRHNDIALRSRRVLRIPLLGLRVAEAEFMAQIKAALGPDS